MELLENFDIDSFLRVAWITKEAKEQWADTLPQINQFIQELEVTSVVEGHRRCTWQTVDTAELIRYTKDWEKKGLYSIPIHQTGQFEGFAHRHAPIIKGKPTNTCVILAKTLEDCKAFRKAFETDDNFTQGQLLGYPDCCSKFFCDVWAKGYYDPIWQAVENTSEEIVTMSDNGRKVRIKGHPLSNAILRYLGLRVCFHIPCAFDCKESIRTATERLELSRKMQPDLTKLLEALMHMPHSWDCYHGIAVVRSPIFYAITSSVPCKERHVVEIEGGFIPKEARRGIGFPFDLVEKEEEKDA